MARRKRSAPVRGWVRDELATVLTYNSGVDTQSLELLLSGEDFEEDAALFDANGATPWYVERLIVEGFAQVTVHGTALREWAKDVTLYIAGMDEKVFTEEVATYSQLTYFHSANSDYIDRVFATQIRCAYPREGIGYDTNNRVPTAEAGTVTRYVPTFGDDGHFRMDITPNCKLYAGKCLVFGVSAFGAIGTNGWENNDEVRVNYGLTALLRQRR